MKEQNRDPTSERNLKTLDSESVEMLRIALLREGDRACPRWMGIDAYELRVQQIVPNATRRDVERELQYLVDKGLFVECIKIISPENRHFRIHAGGRDYLAERRIPRGRSEG